MTRQFHDPFAVATLVIAVLPARAHAQTTPHAPAAVPPAIDWQDAAALITPRDHHSTFLVQRPNANYLYVAGGTNYVNQCRRGRRLAVLTGGQISKAGGVKGLARIAEVFTAHIGKYRAGQ